MKMKDFLKFRFQFGQISQMEIDIINKELEKSVLILIKVIEGLCIVNMALSEEFAKFFMYLIGFILLIWIEVEAGWKKSK